jgi:EcsC protein family
MPVSYPMPATRMNGDDLASLRFAVAALEKTSFAHRLAGMAGRQMGFAGKMIPERLQTLASDAATRALRVALKVAISSLDGVGGVTDAQHRRLAMASGMIGGAAGIAGLPLELPVSTTIMLRAIADIARREGEDLRAPETALACLQVFALGGHAEDGNILEGGYLALRGVFAKTVSDATRYIVQTGALTESAPVMVKLIGQIASRFGVVVSQKTAAQAAPLLGAISGAAINVAFTEHFQSLARGHFTVRRLERAYGPALVRDEYERFARDIEFERDRAKSA